jgi:hypothetical protein
LAATVQVQPGRTGALAVDGLYELLTHQGNVPKIVVDVPALVTRSTLSSVRTYDQEVAAITQSGP